jgi:hypothetical protein
MKLQPLLLSALLLAACKSTTAAPTPTDNPMAVKPGPEHALLAKMAGTWKAEVHMEGSEPETGTMESRLELGGLWLTSRFESEMMGSPFEGRDLFGYDVFKKRYVACWTDSWSAYMVASEGTYDEAARTFTMSGDSIDPMTGSMVKMINVTKLVDDDHMLFSMHMGSADAPATMTIHYTRK